MMGRNVYRRRRCCWASTAARSTSGRWDASLSRSHAHRSRSVYELGWRFLKAADLTRSLTHSIAHTAATRHCSTGITVGRLARVTGIAANSPSCQACRDSRGDRCRDLQRRVPRLCVLDADSTAAPSSDCRAAAREPVRAGAHCPASGVAARLYASMSL